MTGRSLFLKCDLGIFRWNFGCNGTILRCRHPWFGTTSDALCLRLSTQNEDWIPVALCVACGVLDYFATGSLTQLASRVGGIMSNFFFLGQALSGAFLFGFTTSVDWSVEEMASNNAQDYKHHHQDVVRTQAIPTATRFPGTFLTDYVCS